MSVIVKNLQVQVENSQIVKGLDLEVKPGEVHVIMGPNGSGKSTLANTLMGHPKYEVTEGSIEVDGEDVTHAAPDERAHAGLFLSMQYPPEIPGVTIQNFLRTAYKHLRDTTINPLEFNRLIKTKMDVLGIDHSFAQRYLNTGFSGGEKKRAEILQLLLLSPKYAVLDETDSGLDVDALKVVAEGINQFRGKDTGILLITHYNRILEYVKPDVIHIMKGGRIVMSGDATLAHIVEKDGYDTY
jgi:Fe-S cluster assembly ATP-binding protein